jgi:hypothetical protein
MGKWCPKHVEALNPNKSESESESESEVCIKLVMFIKLNTIYMLMLGYARTEFYLHSSVRFVDYLSRQKEFTFS